MPEFFGHVRSVGRQDHDQFSQHILFMTFEVGEFVDADHQRADAGVEGEALGGFFHLFDGPVNTFQFLFRGGVRGPDLSFRLVEEQAPEFTEEAVDAFDAFCIPGLALFDGAEEHFIHPEGIGAVFVHQVVGINRVVKAFAHLFHFHAADVLPVFEDEFGVGVLGAPVPKGVGIQLDAVYDVDVDMELGNIDLAYLDIVVVEKVAYVETDDLVELRVGSDPPETGGNENGGFSRQFGDITGTGEFEAVDETAAALDHALVDQAFVRFVVADQAPVEEEFCPHAAVEQVSDGMFGAADVEVYLAPVVGGRATAEGVVVMRVHIAEEVPAAAGIAGHGIRLQVAGRPGGDVSQGAFAFGAGAIFFYMGKLQRKLCFVQGRGSAVVPGDGKGFSPVALAAEGCVAHPVVDFPRTDAFLFDMFDGD